MARPVELEIEFGGAVVDPWGNRKIGFTASGEVSRQDWGLTWNGVLDSGGVVVSEQIRLDTQVMETRGRTVLGQCPSTAQLWRVAEGGVGEVSPATDRNP